MLVYVCILNIYKNSILIIVVIYLVKSIVLKLVKIMYNIDIKNLLK